MDLIDRQQAIDAIMGEYPDAHYPDWYASIIRALPSAQPELIAQDAYVRGFEQGRIQGKVDAKLQPEEAIPVSWIEAKIERFIMSDDAFGGLTASIIIRAMLNEWEKEQEGDTT